MSTQASGTIWVKTWDEKPYDEIEGRAKLTCASLTQSFHGDTEGGGTLEHVMIYGGDGSARFLGPEHVVGRVGEPRAQAQRHFRRRQVAGDLARAARLWDWRPARQASRQDYPMTFDDPFRVTCLTLLIIPYLPVN